MAGTAGGGIRGVVVGPSGPAAAGAGRCGRACGVLMKQGAADGLVAVAALVLADGWRQRRNPLPDLAVFAGGAALPLLLALLHGVTTVGFDEWWFAMVGHRSTMDSLIRGSYDYHRAKFFESLGPFRRDLGVLVLLAPRHRRGVEGAAPDPAAGVVARAGHRRRSRRCLPSALLAAGGRAARAPRRARHRPRRHTVGAGGMGVGRGGGAGAVGLLAPVYTARTADRVSELTSADHRYVIADEVADAVAAMTEPDDRVAVLWTNAAIHWYADRASPSGTCGSSRSRTSPVPRPPREDHRGGSSGRRRDRDAAGIAGSGRRGGRGARHAYELVDVVEGDRIYRLRPAFAQASVP